MIWVSVIFRIGLGLHQIYEILQRAFIPLCSFTVYRCLVHTKPTYYHFAERCFLQRYGSIVLSLARVVFRFGLGLHQIIDEIHQRAFIPLCSFTVYRCLVHTKSTDHLTTLQKNVSFNGTVVLYLLSFARVIFRFGLGLYQICNPPLNLISVLCVCFLPIIHLDIKFVGRTSRGHTGGRSHRISHPPPFCGACLNFSREKIQPFLSPSTVKSNFVYY